jgi:hypothetical protein
MNKKRVRVRPGRGMEIVAAIIISFAALCATLGGCGGGGGGANDTTLNAAPAVSSPPNGAAAQGNLTVTTPKLSYPLQFLQVFGPTSDADQQGLVGRVGAMWSSSNGAQSGIFSMSYAPAYRLYFMPAGWKGQPDYEATRLGWLYYFHPDWIEYGSDGNVMYQFDNTNYPVVDIASPAVQQYMSQSMLSQATGYAALSLDNVSGKNVNDGPIYQTGHYAGTIAPCPPTSRPACGGRFVTQYASATDPGWSAVNLGYLKFLSAQAAAAGVATVANLSYQRSADWVDEASAVSGVIVENIPQHQGITAIDNWYHGFLIDGLFQLSLYNAEHASGKFYVSVSYLDGHDTNAITQAETAYATAWTLLTMQGTENYMYAGQLGSRVNEPYPPEMGGYVSVTTTGTFSTSNTTVTAIPNTASYMAGQQVSGPGLPAGTRIVSVPSATSITLGAKPTANGTGVSFSIGGFAPLPIGTPAAPPPAVNPNVTPPSGICGWVNGTNAGVCSRQFTNGWVFVNPVCQYDGTSCSVPFNTASIPAPPSGVWYDQFCNLVPAGPRTMSAATALVIAGSAASRCPWPQRHA